MSEPIRVTVWGENVHEKTNRNVAKIYPDGMHTCLASAIAEDSGFVTRTAVLQEPEHGLSVDVLETTDVLTWWGHCAHGEVGDRIVDRVQQRVLEGMGLVVLHSGHFAKIFRRLLGTPCSLTWREAGEKERLWVCNPGHPIAEGLGPYFELQNEEMYGEPFAVPNPDEVVFLSWFEGGEVFRSGLCYKRGNGKIFYFRPGHETYPTYHDATVRRVIRNACRWAAPEGTRWKSIDDAPNVPVEKAPEKIVSKGPLLHGPGEAGLR